MNWLQSVMMGLVSGLCEPMPISAEAHRSLLVHFFGLSAPEPLFLLACHMAVLIVVLSAGRLELHRLWRTAKILRMPQRRRTGHPNLNQAGTLRLLRTAAVLTVIGRLLSIRLSFIADRLWLLAVPLILAGTLLWLPTHMRTANRDGRHMSALDSLLLGLAALSGAVPGLSMVAAVLAIASMRGIQRQYAVRLGWMLLCVNLLTASVMDLVMVIRAAPSFGLNQLIAVGLGALAAAIGAWLAIQAIRSRTRAGAGGINGFCFYNWGMALLCLALFLLV